MVGPLLLRQVPIGHRVRELREGAVDRELAVDGERVPKRVPGVRGSPDDRLVPGRLTPGRQRHAGQETLDLRFGGIVHQLDESGHAVPVSGLVEGPEDHIVDIRRRLAVEIRAEQFSEAGHEWHPFAFRPSVVVTVR